MMEKWAGLPANLARARQKAEEQMASLEARMETLRQQQQDAGEVVARHWREMQDLQRAVGEARAAMLSEGGALALRRRAESLRGILCRVGCEFVATGKRTCGPGNARSKLVGLAFLPVAGEAVRVDVGGRFHGKPWKRNLPLPRLLRSRFKVA
jgi:hypothetical protein